MTADGGTPSTRRILFNVLISLGAALATERVHVDPSTGHFVDKDGRALIFHGVNAVQKSFPWHPSVGDFDPASSLNAEDMANLRSWGFNAVRLGVMWPGVEPTFGEYNETYLQVMRKLVDDLYSHGIYTIVDFHQDSFSEEWCGEGVPRWMVPMLGPFQHTCPTWAHLAGQCKPFKDFNIPVDPATGFPKESDCLKNEFDEYSRAPELVSAWGHFYANQTIQDKFHGYWRKVASTFASSPGVIGYDLVNEPLNGNFFAEPSRLKPGYLDSVVLEPMYKSLYETIKAEDPNAIAMYEPPPFPDTYPYYVPILAGVHPLGLKSGPAAPDVAHQALSYHIYSCGFADKNCDRLGDTKSVDCPRCDRFARDAVTKRDADVKRLGGGVFLTEFGACSGSDKCTAEIDRVLSQADGFFHSWTYWQFKYFHDITTVSGPIEGFYNNDGSLQTAKVTALSRTYASAVAGIPLQMKYDAKTAAFRLRYHASEPTALTNVFLNEAMNYKDGYEVKALNASIQNRSRNQLDILAAKGGVEVDVAIVRKPAGSTSGVLATSEGDEVEWSVGDEGKSGFQLSSSNNDVSTSFKVYTDSGKWLCTLAMAHGDEAHSSCDVPADEKHNFLFDYRIEVWRATTSGAKRHIYTINSSSIGPLLGKRIKLSLAVASKKAAQSDSLVV